MACLERHICKMNKQEKDNKTKERRIKQYEELTFTDNFMFCKIMENNPDVCKKVLEIVLGKRIKEISFVSKESTIDIKWNGKSVRLDVYVDDGKDTIYDIEMQARDNDNLPMRTRYYQSVLDLNQIEKGADYDELKNNMVIFICTFDHFGKGLPVYTFSNRCKEVLELELGDGTNKVFVNAKGNTKNLSEDFRAFLQYLNGEIVEDNSFVSTLENEVEAARNKEEWRVEYMSLMVEFRERYKEGKEDGFAEGISIGVSREMENGIRILIETGQEDGKSKEELVNRLVDKYSLSLEEAQTNVQLYWKTNN